mmetsp:Transcript_10766/g.12414  ORF Transcript_10766/g.12414 Transcript_10766/m.12414 type:complete len:513 (-) Transcript_10766:609-2147(-)
MSLPKVAKTPLLACKNLGVALRKQLFIAFVVLTLFSCATSGLQMQKTDREYGIQIDAGSSGTRLYVYSWTRKQAAKTIYPASQVGWNIENRPGLATYGKNRSRIQRMFRPLLLFASNILKREGLNLQELTNVPVFLGATAGMRLLHPDDAHLIMSNVRRELKRSIFRFENEWARVLSGEEEGVFGWITVNYLLKRLNVDSSGTVGTIDLGGASTQITLHPPEDILANFFPLRLNSMVHNLYTHSYLYYGNDEARNIFERNLLSQPGSAGSKDNPCWPSGYVRSVGDIKLKGTSSWEACKNAARELFESDQIPCKHSDGTRCGILGVYQPSFQGVVRIYAMSYFYYVYLFFDLDDEASLSRLAERASSICSKKFSDFVDYVDGRPVKVQDHDRMLNFCFGAAYVIGLLHEGLHFPLDNTPIVVVDKLNDSDISWAFGSMLWHANVLNMERINGISWLSLAEDYTSQYVQLPRLMLMLFCVETALLIYFFVFFITKKSWCKSKPTDGRGVYETL